MKKLISALLAACLLLAAFAPALCEGVTVGKRDLSLNRDLNRDVTNILVLLQDGEVTDTMMIASIDGVSGRSVMTRVDCALPIDVRDVGTRAAGEIYALGAPGSEGLLAMRTINELLELNVSTYIALDMAMLPELVAAVGALNMQLDAQEAEALGGWEGINELTGEQALSYVRLRLDGDSPARSRGYDALMQLLYQGLHSGDPMSMMSLGVSLLGSMDTNLNPLSAVTLVTAVQGGDDRRELALPEAEGDDAQAMREAFYREVYE